MTDFHAKYIAHELTRRCASDSVEQKHRILVIAPANLRKQWGQELADKFFLPSAILETRTFNEAIRAGNLNPFQRDAVVICSYQFTKKMEPYIRPTPWDLVVIDEAHRLRNVYKPTNKIANAIKQAVAPFRKVLLTATPLQNSLLELYGLVSIIDDFAFGDLKTYRARFTRLKGKSQGTTNSISRRSRLPKCVERWPSMLKTPTPTASVIHSRSVSSATASRSSHRLPR